MTGAELYAAWQALTPELRKAAFAAVLYRSDTMPDGCAEFAAGVRLADADAINTFLALTGSKSRVAA